MPPKYLKQVFMLGRCFKCIVTYDKDNFDAYYKGCHISITRHYLRPKYFCIDVFAPNGGYLVDAMENFATIEEAIQFALTGAQL